VSVHLAYLVAGWLFLVGAYGIVVSRDLVHAVVCLSVAQSSSYVLLLSVGYRRGATSPVFGDIPPGSPVVDPVVQALVFTDVVVSATITALLLALAIQAEKRSGSANPGHVSGLRG
jgi:multicomponent Na+:H+ antiporter subunit C